MLILACTLMETFHQFLKFSCIHGIFPASEIMCQIVCNLLKAICDLSLCFKRNNSICWLYHQRILDREEAQKVKRKERQFFSPDLWNCNVMLIESEFLVNSYSHWTFLGSVLSQMFIGKQVFSLTFVCLPVFYTNSIFPFFSLSNSFLQWAPDFSPCKLL